MNILSLRFNKLILCCLTCFACSSYAQMRIITVAEFIDSTRVIAVGRVEREMWLDSTWIDSVTTPPGVVQFETFTEGRVFSVSVTRVLKGEIGVDTVDIITYEGDDCGSTHIPFISLFARKTYLLFLDTAHVPSALITKYNLHGRTFFAPYWCGTGVIELNNQGGIDMLRETEDSLGITSPTPVAIIPLTGWIDSLSVTIDQALSNGMIGDSAFVDTLHGVLSNARNLLLQGDSAECAFEIVRFDKMIHGASIGFDRIRFVDINVWPSLSSDVTYMRYELPRVPYGYSSLPGVDSLTPNGIQAGSPGFTLTLYGEQFENGATVYWNWSPRPTTFVSPAEVRATISSQDIVNPDTVTVAIVNPGGGTHGAWFIVTPRPTYTLSVTTVGNGTVTKNPDLPAYDSASTVQLTAVPSAPCYAFLGWSGDTSGTTNPIAVSMNSNKAITATFQTDLDLAMENKSCSSDATATNNARHLVKTEEYLHEVFTSGGEVYYRRSPDDGSTWNQTHRLNTAFGENSHPCIIATQGGSLQVVWQRRIAPSVFEVWYVYSQDNGASWSTPSTVPDAGAVEVSQYQIEGVMPVITEWSEGRIMVVYCSDEGLYYHGSEDDGQTWSSPENISGQYNNRVRSPSLAGDGSRAWLAYDYATDPDGPYARTFDGTTWSDEESISSGTDTEYGSTVSLAIDEGGYPLATWSGVSSNMQWGRVVVVCLGYPDNTWSKWFSMFGQWAYDWLNPSITYYEEQARYGIAVINHTAQKQIKQIQLQSVDPPTWAITTLSTTGAWAGVTQESPSSGEPVYCWTDQSASPHEIMVVPHAGLQLRSSEESTTLRHTRLAVVRRNNSMLALEIAPAKIVLATGDTTVLSFKPSALRERDNITLSGMWDYLGSDIVQLPPNARRLVLSKHFVSRGPSIAQRTFALHLLDPSGRPLAVLDTTATSGTVSVSIAEYAGRSVIIRPRLILSGITPTSVTVGVGDVFLVPSSGGTKP
jgi:hypothetical protein